MSHATTPLEDLLTHAMQQMTTAANILEEHIPEMIGDDEDAIERQDTLRALVSRLNKDAYCIQGFLIGLRFNAGDS